MAFEFIQKYTVSSPTATITLNTLPTTYKDLRLFINCKSTDTVSTRPILYVAFNSDTTNTNYVEYNWYTEDGSTGSEFVTSTTKTRMLSLPSSSKSGISSYAFGASEVWINNYNDSSNYQSVYSTVIQAQSSSNYDNWGNGITWKNNSAITDMTFYFDAGNFATGSTISLFGIG